jgi:hypothetical protein
MLSILKLKLVDYFDSLIHDIDFKAEKSIAVSGYNYEEIDQKRTRFISEIKSVEAYNLASLTQRDADELEREIDDEKISQAIFKKFCFILSEDDLAFAKMEPVDAMFGYLIVIDKYFTKKMLAYYKDFIKMIKSAYSEIPQSYFRYKLNVNFLKIFINSFSISLFQYEILLIGQMFLLYG